VNVRNSGSDTQTVALGNGAFAYLQPDWGWGLNNAGILAGRNGVTLIDTAMTVKRAQRLRDAADRVSNGQPVRTIVNTHDHPDHTFGNCVFPHATIVAHDGCRQRAAEVGLTPTSFLALDWAGLELRLPDLTFASKLTTFLDDEPVELLHLGAAHTLDDIVVWLPERKLLYTGDIVVAGGTPYLWDGSLHAYAATLERLRELGAETIVPGHGPVTDASCFEPIARYVRFVQELAVESLRAERSPLEAARGADLGEFAAWGESERLVANLRRAYAELSGNPDAFAGDGDVNVFAAMAALHGAPLEWRLDFPGD
jgi:cyclase